MSARLKDYYAGMALQGLCAAGKSFILEQAPEEIARKAVDFAAATAKEMCSRYGHVSVGSLCARCGSASPMGEPRVRTEKLPKQQTFDGAFEEKKRRGSRQKVR